MVRAPGSIVPVPVDSEHDKVSVSCRGRRTWIGLHGIYRKRDECDINLSECKYNLLLQGLVLRDEPLAIDEMEELPRKEGRTA